MKKIILGFGALAIAIAVVPMFAAFEAHVVNVTATIENALSVPLDPIMFGTVFPQEHLDKTLLVSLSNSFLNEDRVDDVEYIIRQKPKCAWSWQDAEGVWHIDEATTQTGHVIPNGQGGYDINCGTEPQPPVVNGGTSNLGWGVLPSLCEYISKHPDNLPENDGSLDSFHQAFTVDTDSVLWTDTNGRLAKSEQDIEDIWTIDLAVPCFGGYCAQDWADFVADINSQADPSLYTQPISNEHKVFGCDLWIEVGGISLPGLGCQGKIDLMLVVDESGSIGPTNMNAVKAALHDFVDALVLATDGPNAGQSSFASIGVLDQELTDSPAAMHAAIDTLVSGGLTNLSGGIALANVEFNSVRDRADAPNIMLVITDGYPNTCYVGGCGDPAAEAAGYADDARADGTEIYAFGVGTGVNATYLTDEIADPAPPQHYFAVDFATLQTELLGLVSCDD